MYFNKAFVLQTSLDDLYVRYELNGNETTIPTDYREKGYEPPSFGVHLKDQTINKK